MGDKTKLNTCRIFLGISTGTLLLSLFMFIWTYWFHGTMLGPELGANILVIISFACNIIIIVISKSGHIWTEEYRNDDSKNIQSIMNDTEEAF